MRALFLALSFTPLISILGAQSAGSGAARRSITIEPTPFFDTQRAAPRDSIVLYEPAGMTRLASGNVVVGDNGAQAVRFFGPTGTLLSSFGRQGRGPREFELVQVVGTCGSDSVLVLDQANARLTYLTARGDFIGSVQLKSPPYRMSCGRNRTVATVSAARVGDRAPNTAYRSQLTLLIQQLGDTMSRRVAVVPGDQRYRFAGVNDGPQPLGTRTHIAVGGDRVFVAVGDSAVVHTYSLTGRALSGVHVPVTAQRIQPRDIQQFVAHLIARNPGRSPASIRQTFETLSYPRNFPMTGELLVDPAGRLWVEMYRAPHQTTSQWIVIDRDGQGPMRVALPDRFRLAEVGTDYLLGSWRDPDDNVEHLCAYTVRFGKQ